MFSGSFDINITPEHINEFTKFYVELTRDKSKPTSTEKALDIVQTLVGSALALAPLATPLFISMAKTSSVPDNSCGNVKITSTPSPSSDLSSIVSGIFSTDKEEENEVKETTSEEAPKKFKVSKINISSSSSKPSNFLAEIAKTWVKSSEANKDSDVPTNPITALAKLYISATEDKKDESKVETGSEVKNETGNESKVEVAEPVKVPDTIEDVPEPSCILTEEESNEFVRFCSPGFTI